MTAQDVRAWRLWRLRTTLTWLVRLVGAAVLLVTSIVLGGGLPDGGELGEDRPLGHRRVRLVGALSGVGERVLPGRSLRTRALRLPSPRVVHVAGDGDVWLEGWSRNAVLGQLIATPGRSR
ncbi:MAG: hypothetical protein AB7L84_13395 [Acidimicrobiia bacterium]